MKIKYTRLKQIVLEEMRDMGMLPSVEDVEAKEIEPGEEAELVNPIDFVKTLKLKEAAYLRRIAAVRARIESLQKKGK